MNKLLAVVTLAVVTAFSSSAFAEDTAPTQVQAGDTIGRDTGTFNCSLLGEEVRVSLSSDVVAAFSCIELESAINIGTCHTAGQRATRNVECVATGFEADGTTPTWNVEGCSAGASVPVDLSYTGYVASSTGGSVAESPLAGVCDEAAASLLALPIFN